MNKLFTFQLSIIFGLFLMLSSCETDTIIDGSEREATTENTGPFKDCFKTSDCLTVTGEPHGGGDDYAISKECYECLTGNYKSNGSKFSKYLDPISKDAPGLETVDAPLGFHIPHGELREMLDGIQDPANTEIFLMLGLETETDKVPHAIFVVKENVADSLAEGGLTGGGKNTYYDFSAPCPDYCP